MTESTAKEWALRCAIGAGLFLCLLLGGTFDDMSARTLAVVLIALLSVVCAFLVVCLLFDPAYRRDRPPR